MLEQARRSTHDTARHDSHDKSCLSSRDVTQVEFGLIACCVVVELGLGLELVSGWLVVMLTYIC